MDYNVKEITNPNERRFVYVVEGITDEDKLKKLGCLFVIPVGGIYIRGDIIEFLKKVNEIRKIILVLDPDGPGHKIEERLVKELKDVSVVHAKKEEAIKKDKVGIAEMKMDDLKALLRPFITHDLMIEETDSIDDEELFELKLIGKGSKENKAKLIKKYSIPFSSTKKVSEAIDILALNYQEVKKVIEND